MLPVVGDDAPGVVQLVGDGHEQRPLGRLAQVSDVPLLADAPFLLDLSRGRVHEAVGQVAHDGGDVGPELGLDALELGLAAHVLGGVVQERGRHLHLVAAPLHHQRRHRHQVRQVGDLGLLPRLTLELPGRPRERLLDQHATNSSRLPRRTNMCSRARRRRLRASPGTRRTRETHGMRRALVLALAPVLLAGCTWITRSSVPNNPALGTAGNGASSHPSLSQHGGVVAFDSSATNLVANDMNNASDVFVRDHVASTTKRVSVNDASTGGNGASRDPAISDDGRYVAFETDASNLIPGGDSDGKTDIVVRDRVTGTTKAVSIQPNGSPFVQDAIDPAISGNGQFVSFNAYVQFMSFCCVLTGPYVRDTVNNTTTLMPQIGGGIAFNGLPAALSDDGAPHRVRGVRALDNGTGDASYAIAVANTATATIVANVAGGTLSHQSQTYFNLALSGDGHLVAVLFGSTGGGPLVTYDLDAPGLDEVFPNFAQTGQVALSDDGSVIAFRATISGPGGWYLTDPQERAPRVSTNGSGTAASSVDRADLSGDGAWVAFATDDPGMTSGDANGVTDVFTRSAGASSAGPTEP